MTIDDFGERLRKAFATSMHYAPQASIDINTLSDEEFDAALDLLDEIGNTGILGQKFQQTIAEQQQGLRLWEDGEGEVSF